MCQAGGPRCASHSKTEIAKLEAIVDRDEYDEDQTIRTRLVRARLDYAGTPTGQKEIQNKIDAAEETSGESAEKLRAYKDKAHQHYKKQKIVGKVTRSNDLSSLSVEERLTASYSTDSPELIDKLATEDPSERVRYTAISSPYITQEALKEASEDKEPTIRACVAGKTEDEKVQYRLSREKNLVIRNSLASNGNLSQNASNVLAHDTEAMVRESLAKNINTDSHLLHTLSMDPDKHVRRATSQHRNADPSTLDYLSNDKDTEVRLNTANNPHAYESTLTALTQDANNKVAQAARDMLNKRKTE